MQKATSSDGYLTSDVAAAQQRTPEEEPPAGAKGAATHIPAPPSTEQERARVVTKAHLTAAAPRSARSADEAKRLPPFKPGLQELGLSRGRDGLLYLPASYRHSTPAPLVVLLHGAGSDARNGMSLMKGLPLVEESGTVLFAPDSRGRTWDMILDEFGPDVRYIDKALATIFEHYNIDPKRIAISGFSDGASYALSLGIVNGTLFSSVLAFSPGFMRLPAKEASPSIYISHGINDSVLPINNCSRQIVQKLGPKYHLLYREFDGPHTVPLDKAQEALRYFLHGKGAGGAWSA